MQHKTKSIRPFIGSKNFDESRNFYADLGFKESVIDKNLSYFNISDNNGFYLQNAFVKDWVNNTMIFIEVDSASEYWEMLDNLSLHNKYKNVKLIPVKENYWGKECFLHDPSGILWHFGEFN